MENNESTIMEKLAYLEGTKDSIKNAIIAQGQEVSADDTFRSYAQKIANIETGMNTSDATITNLDVLKGKIAYNSTGRVEGRIRTFEDNTNVAMPIHSMAHNDDNEEIIKVCNLDEDVDMVWMTDILSDGNTQFRKMLPISLNIVSNLISENLRDKAVYIDYFAYPYMGSNTNIRHAYDILVSDATGRNTNNRADIHVVDSINYDVFCVEANCTNLTTEEMASSRYSKYMNWYRLEIMTNDYNFVPLNNSFNLSISLIGDHWYSQWMSGSAFYYAYSTTNIYAGVNYKGDYYKQPGSAFSPYLQKQLVSRSGAAYIGNNVNAFTAINLPLLVNADGITPNKIAEGEKILGIEGTFQGGGIDFNNTDLEIEDIAKKSEAYSRFINLYPNNSITNMSEIFSNNINIQTTPMIDTTNITNMSNMFSGCINLINIPLYNTVNVTDMSNMFSGCTNLVNIPILDMSNVINAENMFINCNSLNHRAIENIATMLPNANNLTNQYVESLGINVSNLENNVLVILNNKGYVDAVPTYNPNPNYTITVIT